MRQSTEWTSPWKMRRDPFQVGESSLTITYERFSDVRVVMSLEVSNFSSKRESGGSTIDTVRRINSELVDTVTVVIKLPFRGKGVCSHL